MTLQKHRGSHLRQTGHVGRRIVASDVLLPLALPPRISDFEPCHLSLQHVLIIPLPLSILSLFRWLVVPTPKLGLQHYRLCRWNRTRNLRRLDIQCKQGGPTYRTNQADPFAKSEFVLQFGIQAPSRSETMGKVTETDCFLID